MKKRNSLNRKLTNSSNSQIKRAFLTGKEVVLNKLTKTRDFISGDAIYEVRYNGVMTKDNVISVIKLSNDVI